MCEAEIRKHLFLKQVHCPICEFKFKVNAVKVNSPRILSKDSDFFIRYSSPNPYFYDIWICNNCGYASMKIDFFKIKKHQKEIVLEKIKPLWKPRDYPDIITASIAVERYKLALVTSVILNSNYSNKAMISLKIAWMYRLLGDIQNELHFLEKALKGFNEAYIVESFPMYGLQRDSTMYILGELNRRLGNDSEALIWYSKAITTIGASYKIKELARNGRDLIKANDN
ncbi:MULTISPECIES: DUF2225 domain-containing protein [Clostridium]|uniref:DUF2225 domain-containing protein n=1 Tax=Clostridium aquiflavi TaxID=3073603 RepID=A0ABU1EHV3_9CLOT|nr:DUF2225 domain-containing protein [Clostridium sp. 5N-1]MDR5587966.1 DUF2225 domain-containing protein [Clostridium sp. 5N-1]NFG60828.1 DUF2225 domain-containing protein [Clostridium botulinum]NFQ08262.1 DUF2225 domain-containing protein [Clostridium botulinum]